MHPGRTEEQKTRLAEAIAKNVVEIAKCPATAVSVAIEEVQPPDWPEKVYRPEILEKSETLYLKPGYNPFQ
jgi:4-oxalocrotonate tautomerase